MTNNTIEQKIELKDGRIIYKTHNGFRSWVLAKDSTKPIEVSDKCYNQVKKNAKGGLKAKKKSGKGKANRVPKFLNSK